jgi:DNA adenine methylase
LTGIPNSDTLRNRQSASSVTAPGRDDFVQTLLFSDGQRVEVTPFTAGLLKWVGSKQRTAHVIASYFPTTYGTYFEPFLGSGAVLGTLRPRRALGSDVFAPLMEIWQALRMEPNLLKRWYADRYDRTTTGDRVGVYEQIKASYNQRPNGADLLFLSRACYAGVVRFRKADGYMSTPCGPHKPIPPAAFARRVDQWRERTRSAEFLRLDYHEAMARAKAGDLIYCDPPYVHSQAILYGAQRFQLRRLLDAIADCKARGVYVALSIDGTKRSGRHICRLAIPDGLFEREVLVNCGRSMLRRLQLSGRSLEGEVVADRLLLTY